MLLFPCIHDESIYLRKRLLQYFKKIGLIEIATLPKANPSTVSRFSNSIQNQWPQEIWYENVLLVTTGAAAYMCKVMKALQIFCPKMIQW